MAEVLLNFKVSTLCETLVSVADPLIHPKTVSSILKLVEFGPELVDRESIPGGCHSFLVISFSSLTVRVM